MDSHKVKLFLELAGYSIDKKFKKGSRSDRELGARLLLSETLEYVIKGLGLYPVVDGVEIRDPNALEFVKKDKPDGVEMLDGLADVAYTMYWNSLVFGLPLEEGYDQVCDNNLEKFVLLVDWEEGERKLKKFEWDLGKGVKWPKSVTSVSIVKVEGKFYAVGKDEGGKVRKPSTYTSVNLKPLIEHAA